MSQFEITREQEADAFAERKAVILIIILVLGSMVVNALSRSADLANLDIHRHWSSVWIEEGSSAILSIALLPAIAWLAGRFVIEFENWIEWVPVYLFAGVVFSICHVFGMFAIRVVLFPILTGGNVDLSDGVISIFFYEYRKDFLTFSIFVLAFYSTREVEQKRLEARMVKKDAIEQHRLTLKCGGRTIWINAAEVVWAKAASNYVEIHTAEKTLLARSTLANVEGQLRAAGLNIARVHRSYLVDTSKVSEMSPTGEGDARILMSDGETIPGSRRYRDAWPTS